MSEFALKGSLRILVAMRWSAIFMLLAFVSPLQSYGLSVDEKLTFRILKSSDTKFTILINRGIEDGLVVGDHAHFFTTKGSVARAIVIKTSPTRSVWSIYKMVDSNEVVPDNVLNLKITPAVELTNDPTRMLRQNDFDVAKSKDVILSEKEKEIEKNLTPQEREELKLLQSSLPDAVPFMTDRVWELWGTLHLTAMTSTNSLGAEGQGSTSNAQVYDAMVGIEKYFLTTNQWYSNLSISPFLHFGKQETSSVRGERVSSQIVGYGAGFNYHFLSSPMAVGKLMSFAAVSVGMGSSEEEFEANPQSSLSSSSSAQSSYGPLQGKVTFFSIGGGVKYYFGRGFGLRAVVDYYQRAEVYPVENTEDDYTKVVKGPRILLGLSYRW